MLKQLAFLVFIAVFMPMVMGAAVQITTDITEQEATFQYLIQFNEEEDYNSFSFEKPRDAIVFYSKDQNEEAVRYSSAGDFFIIRPSEGTEGKTIDIRFISREMVEDVKEKSSFSHYVNFNVPVENLLYELSVVSSLGVVEDVFPRDYQINDEGKITWLVDNIEEDTLFLLNFEGSTAPTPGGFFNSPLFYMSGGIILVLLIVGLLFLIFSFVKKKKEPEEKSKEKASDKEEEEEQSKEKKSLLPLGKKEKEEPEEKKETYEEIINKYLTDNEREVVEVVKEHSGISQYDILNFLPHLTKSNLSKIISKLHNKKFLNRIRVGKVNKIHLGERLED